MKLSTKPYKGTRDFYPEDMRLRNWMFSRIRSECISYGYEEYVAPVLEPLEIYAAKTSEEIVAEQTYSFTDRGDRKVVMRPEMTPSVSRMVAARRQELGYPLRLFNIANFFRYERPQKGRLREFWQLNADIFGVEGVEADMEIIQLADSIMKAFGASEDMYEIRVNSRAEMDEFLSKSDLKDKQQFMRLIDKKNKMDADKFNAAVKDMSATAVVEKLENLSASKRINSLLDSLKASGVTNVVYDPALARGFNYYTDIVFEVFDKNPENNRSLFGGGRYDGLVGEFGVEPVPTVGFGMGDVTLENFLRSNDLIPAEVGKPETDLVLIGIGIDPQEINSIASELRRAGINIAIDYTDRKLEKKIKFAEKLGVENMLFVGEEEVKAGKYTLKNIKTGQEQKLQIGELIRNLHKTT